MPCRERAPEAFWECPCPDSGRSPGGLLRGQSRGSLPEPGRIEAFASALPELEGREAKPDRMDPMPTQDKKVLISAIALGLVALFWGTSFAVIKDIIDSIPPFTLMMLRFGFSTILLALVFGHRLKRITGPQARKSAIIGLFLAAAFVALDPRDPAYDRLQPVLPGGRLRHLRAFPGLGHHAGASPDRFCGPRRPPGHPRASAS